MVTRALDVIISLAVLTLTVPVLLLAAAGIKLSSRGPVFYLSRRAGKGRKPFFMLKLRTMQVGADRGAAITVGGDARVTRVGRVLRGTKIDELPQFLNVLRGDMSIVGPRPEAFRIVEEYYTPADLRLLTVSPGITGPGQIYYYLHQESQLPPAGVDAETFYARGQLPQKLACDMHYVLHASTAYYLTMILVTAALVVCRMLRLKFPYEPPMDATFDLSPRTGRPRVIQELQIAAELPEPISGSDYLTGLRD
jgi:lipopolysaccharide/colanic/teichoic acid biosynthesis glycosyltransferase